MKLFVAFSLQMLSKLCIYDYANLVAFPALELGTKYSVQQMTRTHGRIFGFRLDPHLAYVPTF